MPLINKPSKKAFKENMKSEMMSGEPKDQSLAISYDVQRRNKRKKMAEGGMVKEDMQSEDKPSSVASAIMSRRKMADGGEVDLDHNSMEQANIYEDRNEDVLKENYDEDMTSMSQPMDSNEHGDSREMSTEDAHDMISAIRTKMKSLRKS